MHHAIPALDQRPLARRSQPGGGNVDAASAQRLCDLASVLVAAAFAVPFAELLARSRRTPYVAFARQSAMYLANVSLGVSFSDIGRGFHRDRTTAAHACRLVEDRRDDPAVDAVMAALEDACGRLRRDLSVSVRS